jgi:hypothetical protein
MKGTWISGLGSLVLDLCQVWRRRTTVPMEGTCQLRSAGGGGWVAGPGGGGGGAPGGGPPVPKDSPTLRIRNTTHPYCTVHVQDPGSAYNKSIHAVKKG